MQIAAWLLGLASTALLVQPAMAWQEGDRQAYNNKMALLKVLVDGAKQRVSSNGDLETLCLLMSIGNDVTLRYVQLNPEDLQIKDRLSGMRDDLTVCLALLYNHPADIFGNDAVE
tara:strand:+ start:1313 stop:1657 length:345 start_codon:yes stop_codon:yes gene_type:complete